MLQNSKIHYLTNSNYHSDTLVFSEQKGLKNKKSDNIKNLKKLVKSNEFKKFFFCFNSNISKKKITKICDEYDIDFDIQSSIYDQSNSNKKFSLVNISIDKSFILNLEANRSLFLSEHDFFDKIIKKITDKGTRNDSIINEFNQLSLGDLIVHIDHGVGRFNGLKKIISEIEQEFIELIYFNNDKLLIPIENLELISRYGFSEKKFS